MQPGWIFRQPRICDSYQCCVPLYIYHNNFKRKDFIQHEIFVRVYTKAQPFKCCRNNHCVSFVVAPEETHCNGDPVTVLWGQEKLF